MSSDKVLAISSEVIQCGKRLSDSKKKFIWRFKIGDTTYDLQLISSAISGKRTITLNNQQIYTEQNLLNIKFDFSHNIQGHSLRIFRQTEGVHNFDLRIDNRSFQYLLKKKDNPVTENKVTGKYEASNNDPFSQFGKIAESGSGKNDNNFGDFDDFQWDKTEKKPEQSRKIQQVKKVSMDKQPLINVESFETNNFNNFQKNFNNADLISAQNFTTNNYGNYNNYIDLMSDNQGKSDKWGVEVDPSKQTFFQKHGMIPDITGKQMINKTIMTAVQIKKKAANQIQSLI